MITKHENSKDNTLEHGREFKFLHLLKFKIDKKDCGTYLNHETRDWRG
jgi:hypothetical protein